MRQRILQFKTRYFAGTFLALLLLQGTAAHAAGETCAAVFSRERRGLEVDTAIPAATRAVIEETYAAVAGIASGLKVPAKIRIVVDRESRHFGLARFDNGTVEIPEFALKLSPQALRALLAHELAHLIVAANLHNSGTDAGKSLLEIAMGLRADRMAMNIALLPHSTFAEFLCDTMSVLVTRDPRAISKLVDELGALAPADKKAVVLREFGNALDRRDFSLSPDDPRWANYKPNNMDYGRFNQLRAMLWARKIQNLPAAEAAAFFAKLTKVLEPIYQGGRIDVMVMTQGLPATNEALMQYLETAL